MESLLLQLVLPHVSLSNVNQSHFKILLRSLASLELKFKLKVSLIWCQLSVFTTAAAAITTTINTNKRARRCSQSGKKPVNDSCSFAHQIPQQCLLLIDALYFSFFFSLCSLSSSSSSPSPQEQPHTSMLVLLCSSLDGFFLLLCHLVSFRFFSFHITIVSFH